MLSKLEETPLISNHQSSSLGKYLLYFLVAQLLLVVGLAVLVSVVSIRGYERETQLTPNVTVSVTQPGLFFAFQHDNLDFVKTDLTSYYTTVHNSVVNQLSNQWISYFNSTFNLPSYSDAQRRNMTVVFDIDETSLSNFPYYLAWDYGWNQNEWDNWVASGNASAIPGTLTFYNYLLSWNVSATFITGRSLYTVGTNDTYNSTYSNLVRAGYTQFSQLILRNQNETTLSADVYKSNHRRQIAESGVQIIGCIGDQISDCSLGYTGPLVMKIPNYIYFIA